MTAATSYEPHPYSEILPRLSEDEYEKLRELIAADGLETPIVLYEGKVLDGRHRLRACDDLGVEPRFVEYRGAMHPADWVVLNQIGRRNLQTQQRVFVAIKRKKVLAEVAKERQRVRKGDQPGTNPDTCPELPWGDARDHAGAEYDVSGRSVSRGEEIERDAPELLERLERSIEDGGIPVEPLRKIAKLEPEQRQAALARVDAGAKPADAIREVKRESDRKRLEEARSNIDEELRISLEAACDLRVCSCEHLFSKDGVRPDAVITDPPYPEEFLHTFTELAIGCSQANVPTVAVMSGQTYLPEVFKRLCEYLRYRWTLAYLTPGGQAVQQWTAKVNTSWKPVLLFGEGDVWFGDVATSKVNDNDKRFHNWGQSESGMADLVSRLTKPGDLVCDPFLGGGTTAVVSLALGRRFVGCDVDPKCIDDTRARVEVLA